MCNVSCHADLSCVMCHDATCHSYLDLSRMLTCLGGSLLSWGGEVAGEPQLEDPELELDIELVLCLLFSEGIP